MLFVRVSSSVWWSDCFLLWKLFWPRGGSKPWEVWGAAMGGMFRAVILCCVVSAEALMQSVISVSVYCFNPDPYTHSECPHYWNVTHSWQCSSQWKPLLAFPPLRRPAAKSGTSCFRGYTLSGPQPRLFFFSLFFGLVLILEFNGTFPVTCGGFGAGRAFSSTLYTQTSRRG